MLPDNRILYFYSSFCLTFHNNAMNVTKKRWLPIVIPLFLFLQCNQVHQTRDNYNGQGLHNQLTDEEKNTGWELLFDGKTTAGWRGFQSDGIPDGWIAEEGNLVALGKGGDPEGDIITEKQFEDFELYLEWAIAPGGNSGIFFHVLEGDYPTVYATGPEYQLIDDDGFPESLHEWQKTGANYAMHDPGPKTLKPADEFNTSRIIVRNPNVQHYLNGELVVEYELWSEEWLESVRNGKWSEYPGYGLARSGHIGLQDHGSVVRFRNIKIRDLTGAGNPLFNEENLEGWKIHGTELWYAENGELICESGPDKAYGYLATTESYDNFVLRLEFRQESNGNSGVFFRSSLDGTIIRGWQAEVAPAGFGTGGIYESYGRGWLYQIAPEKEKILKEDDWNRMVIEVNGSRVMTWLNNELMTDLTDEKIGEGKGVIALQIHDGGGVKVRWRNIFIRELK
jgi:hypothetical protein